MKPELVRGGSSASRSRGYLSYQHPYPDPLPSRDEEDAARPEKDQPSPSAGKISSPFLQLAQDPTMPTYKQGILARKMHHDADGKKSKCLLLGTKGCVGRALRGDPVLYCPIHKRMSDLCFFSGLPS